VSKTLQRPVEWGIRGAVAHGLLFTCLERESENMAFSDEWMVGGVTEGSEQSLQILARSIVREMKRSGYSKAQMVGLASEVIDLVSRDLRAESSLSDTPV
jgi:hypothetical protein